MVNPLPFSTVRFDLHGQRNQGLVSEEQGWRQRLEPAPQAAHRPPGGEGIYSLYGILGLPGGFVRPAYQTDITKDEMEVSWPENGDIDFKEWFDGNIVWSYFDSAYPWTRLGYTYDWADNGTDYGLTEFIIQNGAPVDIELLYTNEEFLNWLAA